MNKYLYSRRKKCFCDLLRQERKIQLLRQEDLAERLETRQDLVNKIEKGVRRIDIIEMIAYCEALGFTLSEFAQKIESRFYAERVPIKPLKRKK